mgnify:CR=1 FL=1
MKRLRKLKPYLFSALGFALLTVFVVVSPAAEAANPLGNNPFQIFGGGKSIDQVGQEIQQDMLGIVRLVQVIGAVVAVGFLVWGGILFSSSANNPNRRAGAIACLFGAVIGIIIIANAGYIGGWIGSLTFGP